MALSLCVNAPDRTAVLQSTLKYHKSAVLHNLGHILKLHAKTKVRLIRAVAVHGLPPGHALDGQLYIKVADFLEQLL